MPAATHVEKEGSFTQDAADGAVARQGARAARRRAQRAVVHAPPGQARACAHYAGSRADRDWPIVNLQWDYAEHGAIARARRRGRAARDQRLRRGDAASPCPASRSSRTTARTACGCWIYSGIFADGVNQARRREPGDIETPRAAGSRPSGRGRGRPTAASSTTAPRADPDGKPWSERKKYVWWDEGEQVDRLRRARLPRRQARRTTGRADDADRHGRDRRRRPVHHDGRRPAPGCTRPPACSTARCRRTTSRSSRRCRTRSTRRSAPTPRR